MARSLARWPNVPAVYGWLALDRRGNWRIRSASAIHSFERIANAALNAFIARNYEHDERGRWFFQNGPQRVYVRLAYTPLVVHHEGEVLFDQCDRVFQAGEKLVDEEGSLLMAGAGTVALLDDRDLARYAEEADSLRRIKSAEVQGLFGFVSDPVP